VEYVRRVVQTVQTYHRVLNPGETSPFSLVPWGLLKKGIRQRCNPFQRFKTKWQRRSDR